ncbi:MAG: hypothetical protein ABIK28_09470 [Planctomycetota bacterium]
MTYTQSRIEIHFPRMLTGFVLFLCLAAGPAKGDEDESGFFSPLFGWNRSESSEYSFVVPFYSHHLSSKKDTELTLIYPLLSALYRGNVSDHTHVDGAACLPLLALIGKMESGKHGASGYFSPLLAMGSYQWESGENRIEGSGLSLLPWLPLLDDFQNLSLYSTCKASGLGGDYSYWDVLAIPGLDFSLFESRSAGIEEEFRFGSLWNISLYRSVLNLPGCGYAPGLDELSTQRLIHDLFHQKKGFADDRLEGLSARLNQRLDEARSGSPIDRTSLIDPMFVYESRGEDFFALGAEPLFFFDDQEGFSLPILLTTFDDEGVRFCYPAIKHLFPLVHGNRDNTRFDFLAHLGTFYASDEYTALDLKLIFNYQHHARRGTAWGFLPYFFGDFPGEELNEQARFVQLPAHVLSWWDLDGEQGCEFLAPFLFSWKKTRERTRTRVLALFGFSSDEATAFQFDFCGLPLISIDND